MMENTFYRVTKPPKFRWCKLLKQGGKDFSYVIKYNIYNILYKLNILYYYSYEDSGTQFIDKYPEDINLNTPLFKAKLRCSLFKDFYIDQKYFYKKTKDGSKKILFTVKDNINETFFLEAHLEEVYVVIGNRPFLISGSNTLNTVTEYVGDYNNPTVSHYDEVTYCFDSVCNLKTKCLVNSDNINTIEVKYSVEDIKNSFEAVLISKHLINFRKEKIL